jgi:dTDP-4-amino-4,6-dideoxygalactose transaminase
MPLRPRHHIDIGLRDLLWTLSACARHTSDRDAATQAARVEGLVCPAGQVIATHSVRSAFDLLLTTLALPPGTWVLLSALTIPDMARIVRAHGLVPVPVDVDADTLAPTEQSLARAWSPKAKVLVVAQLLGGRADMRASQRFAQERGLLLVDDNAQGYTGLASLEGSPADVVFHSFGSIKTATCLGGGLLRVKDPGLGARLRQTHDGWPVHPSPAYAKKVALYTSLLAPRQPHAYQAFAAACERLGPGLDGTVMAMTKGFPAADVPSFLRSIRRRPSAPMLALLHRRLRGALGPRVAARARAGEQMRAMLTDRVRVLGHAMAERTHWLFAVLVTDPDAYIRPLRRAGFDAARGTTSIAAVPAPDERPDLEPVAAQAAMEQVLFLPVYPEITDAERARLAELIVARVGHGQPQPRD